MSDEKCLPQPYVICTIITPDYLHYALALRESLIIYNHNLHFYILLSDKHELNIDTLENEFSDLYFIEINELCTEKIGKDLKDKYYPNAMDSFRWSMKPVLMSYLLFKKGYTKVIYLDCDIHFYSDYSFLFDLLSDYTIILSPHNRCLDPEVDSKNFIKNFKEGVYNGGFIGANNHACSALNWFAKACLYKCEKKIEWGYYVDQKYLDILPARFEKVYSIQHLGCNLAEWNISECRRELVNDDVKINGVFSVIFIHFVFHTVARILQGDDMLLHPFLELYNARLKKYKANFDLIEECKKKLADTENNSIASNSKSIFQPGNSLRFSKFFRNFFKE